MRLKCLMYWRWLMNSSGDRFKIVNTESPRIEITVPADDIEWMVIENMAGYQCPHCGETSDPFGQGGAEASAAKLGVPFLGRLPLSASLREASDAGRPPAADDGPAAEAFAALAKRVLAQLEKLPT